MNSKIILENSLQSFFFDQLQDVNKKSISPLMNETIHYSSMVMDQFGESGKLFELNEGRVREKILGLKLLESTNMSRVEQRRVLRDIGDTALFVCGFFSPSLNNKIVDSKYYQDLGQIAYQRLNSIEPESYKIKSFYSILSQSFGQLTNIMSVIAQRMAEISEDQKYSDILIVLDKKVS
jgi:hypothetical protein